MLSKHGGSSRQPCLKLSQHCHGLYRSLSECSSKVCVCACVCGKQVFLQTVATMSTKCGDMKKEN